MIYSVNFMDLTERINPPDVCMYLESTNWMEIPFKREGVKVYQCLRGESLRQVMVPMNKGFSDYKMVMYDVIQNIAELAEKPVERIMLNLLNPNSDILKIRIAKENMESGSILFDDAIRLYDNAKRLLAATALDIINPKKIHYGRMDESVQNFLMQCRFGQTEIGSYVVSVVCPFERTIDMGADRQLSLFSDEDRYAMSLTRRVMKKLMDNVMLVKQRVDANEEELLIEDKAISANFLEALIGLNLQSGNTHVELTTEWAPLVKKNRSDCNDIELTSSYYRPISNVVNQIRNETDKRTTIIGRISQLSASPKVDERTGGNIKVSYVSDDNRARTAVVYLPKEDYSEAVEAHQHGSTVKVVGDLSGGKSLSVKNAIFSVLE